MNEFQLEMNENMTACPSYNIFVFWREPSTYTADYIEE